jgi:hypothetical protein
MTAEEVIKVLTPQSVDANGTRVPLAVSYVPCAAERIALAHATPQPGRTQPGQGSCIGEIGATTPSISVTLAEDPGQPRVMRVYILGTQEKLPDASAASWERYKQRIVHDFGKPDVIAATANNVSKTLEYKYILRCPATEDCRASTWGDQHHPYAIGHIDSTTSLGNPKIGGGGYLQDVDAEGSETLYNWGYRQRSETAALAIERAIYRKMHPFNANAFNPSALLGSMQNNPAMQNAQKKLAELRKAMQQCMSPPSSSCSASSQQIIDAMKAMQQKSVTP